MNSVRTAVLEIFYEEVGPEDGPPILILHAWPDAPRGWTKVSRSFHMIQGADVCDAPQESEGLDRFFVGGYQRLLLVRVAHFPHREAPEQVADAFISLFEDYPRQ